MTAMAALEAARLAWERSQPQLFLELNDPAPAATDGSADAPKRSSNRERSPGPDTPLVGGTIGASPCSVARPTIPGSRPPASTTPRNPTATAANLPKVGAAVAGGDFT